MLLGLEFTLAATLTTLSTTLVTNFPNYSVRLFCFHFRQMQNFLDFSLRMLLASALIQPHFDYACSAWFPMLNKRLTKKIQTAQNKCIRFCLNLNNRAHIGIKEFKDINWLSTKERFEQCTATNVFKFFDNSAPSYGCV